VKYLYSQGGCCLINTQFSCRLGITRPNIRDPLVMIGVRLTCHGCLHPRSLISHMRGLWGCTLTTHFSSPTKTIAINLRHPDNPICSVNARFFTLCNPSQPNCPSLPCEIGSSTKDADKGLVEDNLLPTRKYSVLISSITTTNSHTTFNSFYITHRSDLHHSVDTYFLRSDNSSSKVPKQCHNLQAQYLGRGCDTANIGAHTVYHRQILCIA
jgi:hypothetical protein